MRFFDYSHRHGKELVQMLHPAEYEEITTIFRRLDPFPHGAVKNTTPVHHISEPFRENGWELEKVIPLSENKSDYCDMYKNTRARVQTSEHRTTETQRWIHGESH